MKRLDTCRSDLDDITIFQEGKHAPASNLAPEGYSFVSQIPAKLKELGSGALQFLSHGSGTCS